MDKQTIYTVGGTVQAGGGVYIKRKADDELLELCRQGEFAFILSSRQVGKSSLMVRTAQQLEKENVRSVIIDLSAIGVQVSQDEWYLGILNEIQNTLDLQTDIFTWWKQYAQLGPAQRLTNFFRDVLLKEVKEQVVLFFDEIDSTLSIPFSDDFYVALRAVHNARSTTPDFKRLSFVLVGVAAPSDLISDSKRTPFNIGHRVELTDFTLAEALPLAQGLGEQAVQVLTWVFQYTSGHPYLTQRLCAHLSTLQGSIDEALVGQAVDRLFTGEQGKQDNNLQFVRDMLSRRSPDVTRVLVIYRDIRSGKRVLDDERSVAKAHLKLSGLVRSERGTLRVRNEIYNSVFTPEWVQETIPKNWQKIALISLSAILGTLILGALAIFINDSVVGSRINMHYRNFISSSDPRQRLNHLAEMYQQQGILSNRDSNFAASELFYENLFTTQDQLALFRVASYGPPRGSPERVALDNDLVVVISNLSVTVANVNEEEDNTELLEAMLAAISTVENKTRSLLTATQLKEALAAWIEGRKSYASGDYGPALDHYNSAITTAPWNHAMRYERAKVYVARGEYENALTDLDATIAAAQEALADSVATPTASAVSASATVNVTEAQTSEPAASSTPRTPVPGGGSRTPVPLATLMPGAEITATPSPVPTSTYALPPKFESNFTTLGQIISAVQAVIRNSPELQSAMQTTSGGYTNLQQSGLLNFTPAPPTGLLAAIRDRGFILVATDPNYEPQSFLNPEGQRPQDTNCPPDMLTTAEMQGFDVDVAIALGEALGVETCFATPDWEAVTAGGWEDRWDISIGSMSITGSRQQALDFSLPYYYVPYVIAVHSESGITSLADVEGQALCVGASTLAETWLNGGELDPPASAIFSAVPPNVTVVSRNTDEECAQELAASQTQQQSAAQFIGYVTSETIVDANIAAGFSVVQLSPPVFAEEIAAAFDKASSLPTQTLRAEVDRLFSAMHDDGRLSELSIKWYGADWTKAPDTSPSISTVVPTSTPEPFGIGSTMVWPQDGMTLLYVPAGEFRMGITGQESDEKPVHVVSLDAYWIDQTEVTNTMYALCVNESQCNRPGSFRSRTRSSYYGSKEFGDYPVIHISWEDARSYCEWVGRRLPTEAEWEKAARGLDQRNYPWGEGIDCSLANYYDGKSFCVGDTSPVKSYESGLSPYGVYDMAGNVWEWVADWYMPDYYDISPASNPVGPDTGELRVARGGSWEDTDFLARTANRGSFAPGGRNDARGFRCTFSE